MNTSPASYHQANENNLFQFHFDPLSSFIPNQSVEEAPQFITHQQPETFYSYFSDNQISPQHQEKAEFASPQLKPKHASPFQRKRCKTVAEPPSNHVAFLSPDSTPNSKTHAKAESEKGDGDDDDDDDETESDCESNDESVGSNKKRGKYKVYNETEKATILNFMMKHGIQKTLEIFSSSTHKITKRKLKSWIESQHKVKGVKGRKTNDPNRDQMLYEWCVAFHRECGRAPTRKEATKKALELSEDPSFQASKGWLDKFSRKYNIELTPLKIIPPKTKRLPDGFADCDSGSSVSNSDSSSVESMSPLLRAMQSMQPNQQPKDMGIKPWSLENNLPQNEFKNEFVEYDGHQINSFFDFTNKSTTFEGTNYEKKDSIPSLEQGYNQQPLNGGFSSHFARFINYQPNYQINPQPQMEQNFQSRFPMYNQAHSTSFFSQKPQYDTQYNEAMKLEHPY